MLFVALMYTMGINYYSSLKFKLAKYLCNIKMFPRKASFPAMHAVKYVIHLLSVCTDIFICLISHTHAHTVPASRNEYQSIRMQLESETIPPERPGDPPRSFHSLHPVDQAAMEKKRLAGQSRHIRDHRAVVHTDHRIP